MKAALHYFRLLVLFAVAVTVGASDKADLSKVDPFCEYVGQWVELRHPVAVVERHSMWGSIKGVRSKRKADYGIVETNEVYGAKVFGTLPTGHKVRIDAVRDEVSLDLAEIKAYGRTTLPWNNKDVTVAYTWGDTWILHPAPWEPDNTSKQRGPPGKLPPHFDYDMFKPPPGTPQWGLRGCESSGARDQTNTPPAVPKIEEKKVPDAPRVGDAPRVPDAKQ